MAESIPTFIVKFTKAITENYAAVFAGAGLSKSSGFVNWKELLRPLAEEIGLKVDREHDLLSIAQYYCNKKGSRYEVNQEILNKFTDDANFNENIAILTRLPISTYWTTNYDELIEEGLKQSNRKPDIKVTQKSLANNIYDRDAVVYKMHGDVRDPDSTVLIKDDYEMYDLTHSLFTTALKGDLISKTFLFIGFSFDDPNLNSILGRIKALLGNSVRTHYCFFQKVQNCGDIDKYSYNKAKQELIIDDLSRYGIQAVMLDDYSEITSILNEIEEKSHLKNVFISGSLYKACNGWTEERAYDLSHKIAKKLVQMNYRITSGFGIGIGSAVINGALEEITTNKYKHIDEHLNLRPFPQHNSGSKDELVKIWNDYRLEMIHDCGVAIFIFGNKFDGKNVINADGMIKEFVIARNMGKKVIPIGSTGGATKEIMDIVKNDIDDFSYLIPYLTELEIQTDVDKLVIIVEKILRQL